MTILPKRNKRRFEPRDDSTQHSVGTANQDLQALNCPVQLQLQVEQPRRTQSHNHTLSHSHTQSGHPPGHPGQQPGLSRYSQTNVYHNLLHRSDSTAVNASEASKWKRSPPLRCAKSDDHIPTKKSKRAHSKSKHSHHHKSKDNQNFEYLQQSAASYVGLRPQAATAVSVSTSKQTLIPPVPTMATLLSPKMPGGAQDTFGKGRKVAMSDSQVSSDEDCKSSPPSPGGCNSEDEHAPSLQQSQYSEEVCVSFFYYPINLIPSC